MAINVKFGATDAGFTSTIKKVNESMKSMDTNVKKSSESVKTSFASMVKAGAALAIGFGAVKAAASFVTGTIGTFREALDFGGEISDMSARTGIAADQLVILRRAFENAGMSADSVQTSVNKMQRAIVQAGEGSESKAKAFKQLGIDLDEIRQKSPAEQLQMIGDRIASIENDALRSSIAVDIFGKSGAQMLTFFRAGGEEIENAKAQLGSFPKILAEFNVSFDNISDNLAAIGNKFMEFAAGLLSKLAPALELATTWLSRFDAAALGMKLGEIITGGTMAMEGFNSALQALKLGEFQLAFQIAWESIKLQAAQSINSIYKNVIAAGSAAKEFLISAFGPSSSIWSIMLDAFDIVALKMSIAMGTAFKTIAENLWFVSDDSVKRISDAISVQSQIIGIKVQSIRDEIQFIGDDFVKGAENASKAYDDALAKTKDLVSTTELENSLQKSKIGLLERQTDEVKKQVDLQKLINDIDPLKIGRQRVTNAERIKELEMDIATAKATGNKEAIAELEAQKAKYEQLERSLKSGKTMQEAMAEAAKAYNESLRQSLENAKKTTNEIKEQLSLFGQLKDKIAEARAKDKVDPGGRLEARVNDAIGKGRFEVADKIARQINRREQDTAIQKAFGEGRKDMRSIQDIAREQGIDTFRKSSKEIRDELAKLAKQRQEEMKPGKGGKDAKEAGKQPAKRDPIEALSDVVKDIRRLVAVIEPKLPTTALGI